MIKKKQRRNQNTLEQYSQAVGRSMCNCSCYCGPGGYPWREAREEKDYYLLMPMGVTCP